MVWLNFEKFPLASDPQPGIDERRVDVIRAFATLPDEAFGFFCGVMSNTGRTAGGFQHDSRAGVEVLGLLADAYLLATSRP